MPSLANNKKAGTLSTAWKIILGIVLLLAIAIASGIWYWNTHKKAIIRNKLENAVNEKTNGLYTIHYDTLDLNEVAGSLSMTRVSIVYDSSRYAYLKSIEKAPRTLYKISIPTINVSGVKTPRALLHKEIVGHKLEIVNPAIEVHYTTGKDSTHSTATKEIYEQILGDLNLIKVDTVVISNARITTYNGEKGKPLVSIEGISLSLIDVKVDSAGNADTTRILFAKEMKLACKKVNWSDGVYNYSVDSTAINSLFHDITIKSIRIIPIFDEERFATDASLPNDRLDFSFSHIHLLGTNVSRLFENKIVADSIYMQSASFKIYEDLAATSSSSGGGYGFSMKTLEEFSTPFLARKIKIANGFVEYKERNDINRQAGNVQFYKVNALFSNFTNDKNAIATNNIMTLDINSSFLDKTPFIVVWRFYLADPAKRFSLKGNLESIEATALNPITIPMGFVRVSSGKINSVEFDLQQNGLNIDGKVKALYNNMKVDFLKEKKDNTKLKSKTLFNIAANFVIKNDNPSKHEDPRISEVHYEHSAGASIFNMSWRALFKGLREAAGVNK